MNALFQAGREIQKLLNERKWPFCFIGGLAVIRWGEIRMTQDIDLCLFSGFGNETKYIRGLLENFASRIPGALDFALTHRVLLLTAPNGVSVDVSLSGLPFEQQMIERATFFEFAPGCPLITCSAEDLIVIKAFADRAVDRMDIEGIIMRQGRNLDGNSILDRLNPLCEAKEAPEIMTRLKFLLDEWNA